MGKASGDKQQDGRVEAETWELPVLGELLLLLSSCVILGKSLGQITTGFSMGKMRKIYSHLTGAVKNSRQDSEAHAALCLVPRECSI